MNMNTISENIDQNLTPKRAKRGMKVFSLNRKNLNLKTKGQGQSSRPHQYQNENRYDQDGHDVQVGVKYATALRGKTQKHKIEPLRL